MPSGYTAGRSPVIGWSGSLLLSEERLCSFVAILTRRNNALDGERRPSASC